MLCSDMFVRRSIYPCKSPPVVYEVVHLKYINIWMRLRHYEMEIFHSHIEAMTDSYTKC